jgi:hypothetical protein
MQGPHYLKIDKSDYERLARALVVYDHLRHRNAERRGERTSEVSDFQERWLLEAERFGVSLREEEWESLVDEAYDVVDEFLDGETWHELAWWIAEREYRRCSSGCEDKDAKCLVTDRIYHRVMDEFERHGIDRLRLPGRLGRNDSPQRVAKTLNQLRAEIGGIGAGG